MAVIACIHCKAEKDAAEYRIKNNGRVCLACRNRMRLERKRRQELRDPGSTSRAAMAWVKRKVAERDPKFMRMRMVYQRKIKYGITDEQFRALSESQGHLCAICRGPPVGGRTSLCVDHDHVTGKVRALLCLKCNTALGALNESEGLFLEAISYLRRHKGE